MKSFLMLSVVFSSALEASPLDPFLLCEGKDRNETFKLRLAEGKSYTLDILRGKKSPINCGLSITDVSQSRINSTLFYSITSCAGSPPERFGLAPKGYIKEEMNFKFVKMTFRKSVADCKVKTFNDKKFQKLLKAKAL